MSEQSKIEWTDSTWNWSIGCTKVSPGCANCYAEVSTPVRVHRSQGKELWSGTVRQRASEVTFNAPMKWNEKPFVCGYCGHVHSASQLSSYAEVQRCEGCMRETILHRRRVFSLSLGDWLDEAIPIETLADALDVIRRCPNLDFLLLTKRPENFRERLFGIDEEGGALKRFMESEKSSFPDTTGFKMIEWLGEWANGRPPANVWIGTTVENQEYADKRIPELLKIPAVCRFVSYEPALGPVDWRGKLVEWHRDGSSFFHPVPNSIEKRLIDWIICGGESGPKARPFNIEWARSTVEQCRAAGVAVFCKQLGAKPYEPIHDPIVDGTRWLKLNDKKGGDMAEWPSDLRIREFPTLNRMSV